VEYIWCIILLSINFLASGTLLLGCGADVLDAESELLKSSLSSDLQAAAGFRTGDCSRQLQAAGAITTSNPHTAGKYNKPRLIGRANPENVSVMQLKS
jgi:hypothetical protein